MTINVRIASVDDAPIIRQLYDYYIHHTVATFHTALKPLSFYQETIQTLLLDYPYLIAEDETGKMLGFACGEPVRAQMGYRFSVELTIYLHPDAPKRAGIGRALYAYLLPMLQKQGYQLAYAVITGSNQASLSMHRALGFVEVARFEKCGYKQGQWLDTVWLQKTFGSFDAVPTEPIPFAKLRNELPTPLSSMLEGF